MVRRGDDARSALIEQAERLFAERGVEGVSLRDVSAAAGQRNHTAAQYHFGDRAGLVAAVYGARMDVVNSRRLTMLSLIDATGRGDELADLVEAFVVPLVEVIDETGGWYGRFLARLRWDEFGTEVMTGLPSVVSAQRTAKRLQRCLGYLPVAVRHSRIDQFVTMVIGTAAGWEWARHRGERRLPLDVLLAELISTGVSLLEAPLTPPRRAAARHAIAP